MTNLSIVIKVLGVVLVLCVAGIVGLAFHGTPIPDVLQNIAVGDLTALTALLVKPSTPE